jgi:pilus assembly protein CpaE
MNNATLTRVFLVDATPTPTADLHQILGQIPSFMITKVGPHQIKDEAEIDTADVIIVDVESIGEEELQALVEIRARARDTPLFIVSSELSQESMRHLLKYHVTDWIKKPIAKDELLSSIRASIRDTRGSINRVHAVVSCVGGAGATSASISMADIANRTLFPKNPDVALMDLDFSSGDSSYVLNMVNKFNLGSMTNSARRIDSEFIGVIQQRHHTGFCLYSFKQPELLTDINGYELVLRLLDAITLEHECTILDVPYYETEWREEVFSAVNTCTLVSEVNLPAIKHTLDFIERIRRLRGKDFPLHVLFNKKTGGMFSARISKRKLQELMEGESFSYLPMDASLHGEAVDRGVLPSEVSNRSSYLKALTKYMKTMDFVGSKNKESSNEA